MDLRFGARRPPAAACTTATGYCTACKLYAMYVYCTEYKCARGSGYMRDTVLYLAGC